MSPHSAATTGGLCDIIICGALRFVDGGATREQELYSDHPMNALILGKNKLPLLQHIPNDNFLVIDDGPFIDELTKTKRTIRKFDPRKHSLNPLDDITPDKARTLADIIYAVFPQGENTLTVRNGKRALKRLLLDANRLDKLANSKEDDVLEALAAVDDLLFSPTLKHFLCRPSNFSLSGTIVAKLDRSKMTPFDCFVIANFLIAHFPGTIVIPDFGFYQCKFHEALIFQNRLFAGINFFAEVPEFKHQLLLMDNKSPSHCTAEDAAVLAEYAGIAHGTNAFNDFIEKAIR